MNYIVNTCGKEVGNKWINYGINYFTINWRDYDGQIIFNNKSKNIIKATLFIDSALKNGESVLVHSNYGQSRVSCVILGYV